MPYLIPKTDVPNTQYTKMMYNGEVVMMTVIQTGTVFMFTETGETLYVPWDEIVGFAATSESRKRLGDDEPSEKEPAEKQERKPSVREVKPKL